VNADAIIQKYWRAVDDLTNYQQDVLSDDAIRLALSLAVQDAYAAGGALADDLAAIVASQAQATPEQRVAESAINQIGRLTEWLAEAEPALCDDNNLDTAAAIFIAIKRRDIDLAAAYARAETSAALHRSEIDGLRQQLGNVEIKFNELNCELVRLDADNADLLNKVHQAQVEIDRLTRQNVIATDTLNSHLAERTNGAGANPTTARPRRRAASTSRNR
jgi:chromosome segregation ATPase